MKLLRQLGALRILRVPFGAIAQLGERLHGMQEVAGSIPAGSTRINRFPSPSPSSRGLGHHPFTVGTGVRIPVGTPRCERPPSRRLFFALQLLSVVDMTHFEFQSVKAG